MVQDVRNCCRQCSCVNRNTTEQKAIGKKSDFFKCATSLPCEQCIHDKIFLVCCKECVINAPRGDAPQVHTLQNSKFSSLDCDCESGNACAVCLMKRLCGKALVGSKEDAHKERYDKFDSDRHSHYEDYASRRRSNKHRHHSDREYRNGRRERRTHHEKSKRPDSMYSPSENGRSEHGSGKYSYDSVDKRHSEAKGGKTRERSKHDKQRENPERSRKTRSLSSMPESSVRRSSYSPPRNRTSDRKTYAESRQSHGDSIRVVSDRDYSSKGRDRRSAHSEDRLHASDVRSTHSKAQRRYRDVESIGEEKSKRMVEKQYRAMPRNAVEQTQKDNRGQQKPGQQTDKEICTCVDSTVVEKGQESNLANGGKSKTPRALINSGGLDKFKGEEQPLENLGRTVNASDLNRIRLEAKDLFRMEMEDKKCQNKSRDMPQEETSKGSCVPCSCHVQFYASYCEKQPPSDVPKESNCACAFECIR